MFLREVFRIDSREKALLAAEATLDKQAEEVVAIDLRRLSSVIDFFIIATSSSERQTKAIAENVELALDKKHQRVWNIEGAAPRGRARARARKKAASRMHHSSPQESFPQISLSEEEMSWVLMDCGDVVVHVLSPLAREFYQLERLWGDAPRLALDSH